MASLLDGVFAVWKPTGPTSNDVVQKIRRVLEAPISRLLLGRRLRVGHGGTLDPLASGVLVIGVGSGCKLLGHYQKGGKQYRAVGKLGTETDSQDCLGKVIHKATYDHVNETAIQNAMASMTGTVIQQPPIYSALKVGGKRACDLARKGTEVTLQPREIVIHRLDLLSFQSPLFHIEVDCGGGTYVRTIIHDIGRKVGSAAHLTELVRVRQGAYQLENSLSKDWWDFYHINSAIQQWRSDPNNLELLKSKGAVDEEELIESQP